MRTSGQTIYTTPVESLGSLVGLVRPDNLHYTCSISGQSSEVFTPGNLHYTCSISGQSSEVFRPGNLHYTSLGSLVRFSGQSMYTTPVVSLGSIVKLAR